MVDTAKIGHVGDTWVLPSRLSRALGVLASGGGGFSVGVEGGKHEKR